MSQILSTIELMPIQAKESSPPQIPPYTSCPDLLPTGLSPDALSATPSSRMAQLEGRDLKAGRIIIVLTALTSVNFLCSLANGFITIGLPHMASDLGLPEHLLLWPTAVFYLTCASCLLPAGSIADILGNRLVNLTGCFLTSCFIIACGLAHTGIDLIMFRAMQGIAVSLCLPTSVAIVSNAIPSGRKRNIGFSCLGFSQPIGFSTGLLLEGVILDTVGWRFSFYLCGGLSLVVFAVGVWALPRDVMPTVPYLDRLKMEIDWAGLLMTSTCLALFSYVLGTLTNGITSIRQPTNIVLLTLSTALIPAFILWERRRERLHLPAMIPTSLWENTVFTSVCLAVLFSNALANTMEMLCSLFFQNIQHTSALGASLRIIPSLITGFIIQVINGLLIHRITPYVLVMLCLLLSTGAPLLMALTSPHWPYWYSAFPAQLLAPLSCDILFTIGLLTVSEVFPAHTQALAGAVFNTVTQFGASAGLTLTAVVAGAVTKSKGKGDQTQGGEEDLLAGYKAGFWIAFAWMGLACLICALGLRHIGRIGVKRD